MILLGIQMRTLWERVGWGLYVYRRNIYGVSADKVTTISTKIMWSATPRTEVYCRNKLSIVNCKYVGREQRNIRKEMNALMNRPDLIWTCTNSSTHNFYWHQTVVQMLLTEQGVYTSTDNVIIKEAHAERVLSDFFLQLRNGKYSLAREQDFYKRSMSQDTATYTMLKIILKRGLGLELDGGNINCRPTMTCTSALLMRRLKSDTTYGTPPIQTEVEHASEIAACAAPSWSWSQICLWGLCIKTMKNGITPSSSFMHNLHGNFAMRQGRT
jgi:hypothetical protein